MINLHFSILKFSLICVFILAGSFGYAQENYTVYKRFAPTGERLVSIRSNVNYHAYCYISDVNGYLVAEFYLEPYASSRWYFEPYGRWMWRCK